MNKKKLRSLLGLVTGLVLSGAVYGQSLTEIWQQAQARDPGYLAAGREQGIADALRQQAQRVWQPMVMVQGSAGLVNRYGITRDAEFAAPGFSAEDASFRTHQRLAVQGQAAVVASQVLIDREREIQARHLALSADAVALSQELARQNLLLAVVERSLALTYAREQRRLLELQERALAQAHEEIRKRQRLGDATLTDVSEAFERLLSVRAGLAGLSSQIRIKELTIEDWIGRTPSSRVLRGHTTADQLGYGSLEAALRQMTINHPQLRLFDLQAQTAQTQAQMFPEGRDALKVTAIARAGHQLSTGKTLFPWGQQGGEHFVGIEVSMPVLTGGVRQAQSREAAARAEHLVALRDQTRLGLEQSIREIWFYLEASNERLRALEQAYTASQSRLEATRKSHAQGMRSTLELLGAETDRVSAERAVFQERLSLLLNRARLAAATGVLSEEDLTRVDAFLQ
jgi:outer membrane protein